MAKKTKVAAMTAQCIDAVERGLGHDEYAAFRLLKRTSAAAGDPIVTEDRWIEARVTARLMFTPKLSKVEGDYLKLALPLFHMEGWRRPEDTHARGRAVERSIARAELEDLLAGNPLLKRPKDELGWGRAVDRHIELERQRTR